MSIDPDRLRSLPKVELHVHIEGTFTPARIAELAAAAAEEPPRPLDALYDVDNLADFLDTLDWVCGLVRDPATAERVARDFAAYATDQGIVHAEVIANPTHWSGLALDELLPAFARGFETAEAEGLASCWLLPSILRQQTGDEALELAEWMGACGLDRVVGLSIDGNEAAAGRTGARFAPAYRRAAELGFGLTAHAGESSGPEGVLDAVRLLGVSRIDHGVRAIEDPEALAAVRSEDITLNVCLTSNCTLLYRSIDEHPLPALLDAGVSVTINTDDPETLGVTLCSELALAASHCGWGEVELAAATHRAVDAAFCPDDRKAELHGLVDDWLAAHR